MINTCMLCPEATTGVLCAACAASATPDQMRIALDASERIYDDYMAARFAAYLATH